MSMPMPKREFSYADYLSWPEGERVEIIEGEAVAMSPAPSRQHQRILGELARQFSNYLVGKTCDVYMAPFDVRLPKGNEKDDDIRTVVQPDLTVVCDRGKLDDKGCKGSPDLVVEIVSPSSFRHDVLTKLRLYEKAGVREYWIVYPGEKAVVVYKLNAGGKYGEIEPYAAEDTLKVGIFDDLDIHLETVFAE